MMKKIGFDNDLYVNKQTESILKRIEAFDNKLYLEFGGKMFDDLHAARVLPGFDPNVKTKILRNLKDKLEIILCIGAPAIEKNKIRSDFGLTYGNELIRLMKNLRGVGLTVNSVVITQYSEQPAADIFRKRLERMGEKVYIHKLTKDILTTSTQSFPTKATAPTLISKRQNLWSWSTHPDRTPGNWQHVFHNCITNTNAE